MQTRPTPAATDAQFLQHLLGASNRKNPVITLLEEIDRSGSINQAAKTVGMSYKGALLASGEITEAQWQQGLDRLEQVFRAQPPNRTILLKEVVLKNGREPELRIP